MTYFEFYEIPLSFFPDQSLLKQKFIQKSRAHHPDYFTHQPEEQQTAIDQTALNNEAYRVLRSFNETTQYILSLFGLINPEDKGDAVGQDFLMEMMDINEGLMELQMDPDPEKEAKVLEQIEAISNQNMDKWKERAKEYDENGKEEILNDIKQLYLRHKYINRIKGRLEQD